ncbi:MAG: alcohol dehydrogenase catalytic domain-containing protein, partial [Planctomycetes bacterium]|nr:alcohol dehydrogenase catalytic domain-containing protein [Planctomycetota bacterium]
MSIARAAAARVHAHGGVEAVQWEEIPRPAPPPGEVLVEVRAAGMNHLDLWVRRGVPGHRFGLPLTLGSDGAGVVAACGAGVEAIAPGSDVIIVPGLSCGRCAACTSGRDVLCPEYGILGETRDGTCAEFVAVPAGNVVPKPAALDFTAAGSFLLSSLTAWTMLID